MKHTTFKWKGELGIVDPFLELPVQRGQKFWIFLLPNTITSLRHDWTHPQLPSKEQSQTIADSKQWLTDFSNRLGIGYNELIEAANNYLDYEERYCLGEEMPSWMYSHDNINGFWKHFEVITGKKNPRLEDEPSLFFRCSC